jgi:glycosyltransferase involved in cell wall biosynthesis
MAAKEILVVDNKSTDNTVDIVRRFIQENPNAHVQLLEQDKEQGLIPTRNYGFNHATGDVLGRVDSDSMLRPDWVEVVSGIFTEDHDAMGATGPVAYYDMPAAKFGRQADNMIRQHIYKADSGRTLLFGSNMAVRASAWHKIKDQVCRDKEDIMHEDIDISLHLIGNGLATVYSPRMVVGMSARRMDTSLKSFLAYMRRFRNTFAAHPEHTRRVKPEYFLTAMYPILHSWYPVYQRYLRSNDIDPAERVWIKQQMELAKKDAMETWTQYHDVLSPEGVDLTQKDAPADAEIEGASAASDVSDVSDPSGVSDLSAASVASAVSASAQVKAAQKRVLRAQKKLHRAQAKQRLVVEKSHKKLQKKASASAKRTLALKHKKARRAARQARKAARSLEKQTRTRSLTRTPRTRRTR